MKITEPHWFSEGFRLPKERFRNTNVCITQYTRLMIPCTEVYVPIMGKQMYIENQYPSKTWRQVNEK